MPFFENISLEISGNDFNSTTNVNKKNTQISNLKSKIPEADVTNTTLRIKIRNWLFFLTFVFLQIAKSNVDDFCPGLANVTSTALVT